MGVMKLLILNPNTSKSMTDRLCRVAKKTAKRDTTVIATTAKHGVPYIASRAEAQITGALVLDTIAEHAGEIDAVVIAAFGDPGLHAARELFDIPVVGMAEAAILTACMLGDDFAFITFSKQFNLWYEEAVDRSGLRARFAGVLAPSTTFTSIDKIHDEMKPALQELVQQARRELDADVVILAGAPLAGLAQEIDQSDVVLIDPISAAVCQAEALVRLAPTGAFCGGYARPPGKRATGLGPALSQWLDRDA